MKISEVIDLSWRYGAETRLAPGSVPMQIRKSGCTANGDAMELTSVEHFCVHYGTHLDCPAHMIQGGFHIEDRPVGFFVGQGLVVDCSGYAPGTRIGPEILEGVCLDGVDFLLLYTGWAKKFGTDAQYPPVRGACPAARCTSHASRHRHGTEQLRCDWRHVLPDPPVAARTEFQNSARSAAESGPAAWKAVFARSRAAGLRKRRGRPVPCAGSGRSGLKQPLPHSIFASEEKDASQSSTKKTKVLV